MAFGAFWLFTTLTGCSRTSPERARLGADAALWQRRLVAEDSRAATPEAMAPLFEGLRSRQAEVRRIAVRALGRLERDTLVSAIAPLLEDPAVSVRVEAANALGQAVLHGDPSTARAAIVARLDLETDGWVKGMLAESLGRLPAADAATAAAAAQRISALANTVSPSGSATGRSPDDAPNATGSSQAATLLGVARGLYFLARQPAARGTTPAEVAAVLRSLIGYEDPPASAPTASDSPSAPFDRRISVVAAAALVASGEASEQDLLAILGDGDAAVRREAIAGIARLPDEGARRRLLAPTLHDASAVVRLDAVRAYGRLLRDQLGCGPLLDAVHDASAHVVLAAIDLLAGGCRSRPSAPIALLDSIASAFAADTTMADWHAPAHALVALAGLDAARARRRLPPFLRSGDAFVRTYAARAAATLHDTTALARLAADPHPNVRTEAVAGLSRTLGHDADPIFLAQLSEDDGQLLRAAAAALEHSSAAIAPAALLSALDRITTEKRETSRDTRLALLERIDQLGDPDLDSRLRPYLQDFDPAVADSAAAILERWTGSRPPVSPRPLPRLDLPTLAELEELAHARAVITMADGRRIVLHLRPFEAPTNAWRFARLARRGYYDGLTFHRVVPNFVIQGGSPAANEYSGDGPFTRDELGVDGNWRGTVGLSTRGRDTGDAQLYINLVDDVRLDHEYTVFGEVIEGMDVVDSLLEGAVMARVEIRP